MNSWVLYLVGIFFIVGILLSIMTQPALAAESAEGNAEEIKSQESVTVQETEVMDIPAHNGEVVDKLKSGTEVDVYMTDVNEEWNAIVAHDGTIRYVEEAAVALTAPHYEYAYGSDLTRLTGYTGGQLESILKGTGLAGLGNAFAEKEKAYGLNALFLISITRLESGNGSSSLAKNQNNLGGLKNGNSGYLSFDSKEDCVKYMAELLSENYLSENGRFYSGKTVADVSKKYCEQADYWAQSVEGMMKAAYEQIENG